MTRRIAIIQGHPDPSPQRFGRALAAAYADGARAAGHEVRTIDVATLAFPVLRSPADWETGAAPEGVRAAQEAIAWADHLAIFHPLWMGSMPALLKAFLEQVLRPGFAFRYEGKGMPVKLLRGKSARVVVTMGMPAFVYRWIFGAHGLKALERSVLRFCGVKPVRASLVGGTGGAPARTRWLERMRSAGGAAN